MMPLKRNQGGYRRHNGCCRSMSEVSTSRGFTLIEILVTLVIISVGLLGVAGLHALSLRNNYDALIRSHASALAGDIADRMRANRDAAFDGDYDLPMNSDPSAGEGATLADTDLVEWVTRLEEQLPNGDGSIQMAPAPAPGDPQIRLVTITIQWGERSEVDPVTFETRTEI
jgi:type IV pilus assembly protein PilV